ncbi:winged helix-turn-helix domain-containing protein [Halostella litorea]|uniref:winged helix-turn-helix domain-containing protein n=1 Tax=Halostella litorea TaxID=2528831 RepID=UPI0010920949|nr:helix-turn-helix domain-containing protein [Halostella litorea]
MTDDDAARSPEAAFSLLSNETRFAILRALYDADDRSLSFSELRERTGVRDSGQFNYHLGKLVGVFVGEVDDGYALRYAGRRVIGAVLSGAYTRELTVDPVPVDGRCFDCGGGLEATYRDERARIGCRDCGLSVTEFGVPPGLVEGYDREELPYAFDRWIRTQMSQFFAGFCPRCLGRMRTTVDDEPDDDLGLPGLTHACDRCTFSSVSVVGSAVIDHPAVVAFHHDHGVDLRETPLWELDWLISDRHELLSTDPSRVRVVVPLDDETLLVDVDADATVDGYERRSA